MGAISINATNRPASWSVIVPRLAGGSHLGLDDLHPGSAQAAGEADAVGAGAFHADTGDGPEAAQPGQELAVSAGVGGEALNAKEPADVIERRFEREPVERFRPVTEKLIEYARQSFLARGNRKFP